jgi:RNA polymerase sigma-70 factor, ECF subfamily
MMSQPREADDLIRRVEGGDRQALIELFARERGRLRRMVQLRLDHRLRGRVDASDVLQEAYLDVARRAEEYLADPDMPPFLWLRFLTAQRLMALHRHHLGAKAHDAGREVSLHHGALPQATSASLAAMLLGHLTSPTLAARRAEMQLQLREALDGMDEIDREVLTLRHFEELSNDEVAHWLGISKRAASKRYIRALHRFKEMLATLPGGIEEFRP